MKEPLNKLISYLKLPYFYLPFLISLIINLFIWIILIWRVVPSGQWIPLHYNLYFGIDWLGPWWQIFLYPIFGLIIILLNTALSLTIILKDKVFSYLLSYAALLAQFIILFSVITLIIKYFF